MLAEVLTGTAAFLLLSGLTLAPLEALLPARAREALLPRSAPLDALLLLLNALLLTAFGDALDRLGAPLARPGAGWPRLLAVFGLAELCGYAMHRAMHAVPALWRLHAVHHGSEELHWLSAWRQHPLDALLQAAAVSLPGLLLGAPLSQLAGLVLVRRVWTSFIHANVAVDLGPLEHLLATPRFHHGHHGSGPGDLDTNFAGTLPVLDRLFGTLRRSREYPAAYGEATAARTPPSRTP